MIVPGTAKKLYTEHPQDWAGPSLAVRVSHADATRLFLSGYFRNLVEWEGASDLAFRSSLDGDGDLDGELLTSLPGAEAVFVEIDDQGGSERQLANEVLARVDPRLAGYDVLEGLPDFNAVSATANKLPDLSGPLKDSQLLDLTAMTLPNRHGSTAFPLAYCQRRCRLLVSERWVLAAWEPVAESDQLNWRRAQRWPHHGIPGFSFQLNRTHPFGEGSATDLALSVIERIAVNEEYFLRHLMVEIETLEGQFFQALRPGDDGHDQRFVATLDVVADVDRYLSLARGSAVRLRRRVEVSRLSDELPSYSERMSSTLRAGLDAIDAALEQRREDLRSALQVVMTSTEVVRLRTDIVNHRRAERFRELASAFAVLFSILSLILAAYGANVRELSPDAQGSLIALALLVGVAVFLVAVGFALRFRWRERQRRRSAGDVLPTSEVRHD